MKIIHRAVCVALAAALALPVATTAAAQDGVDTIELLAHATGLTVRQVKMVLGNPTAFAEYRVSYAMTDARFERAVGPDIYRDLKQNRELSPQQLEDLIAIAHARSAEKLASK